MKKSFLVKLSDSGTVEFCEVSAVYVTPGGLLMLKPGKVNKSVRNVPELKITLDSISKSMERG